MDDDTRDRTIAPLDPEYLETRLRAVSRLDDPELRHLVRVLTGCSLLLTDVYSDERIARVMERDRSVLDHLVGQILDAERPDGGEALYRIRRLPDDVRMVGDKALFDFGFLGLRRIKGYELEDLGVRAYLAASQALGLLAEDRRLKEFFRQNKLLVLPLEDEVNFLRRCAERFPAHAEALRSLQGPAATRVPLMAAVAEAVAPTDYVEAARGESDRGSIFSRDQLLSAYERMLLFAGLDIDRLRDALSATVVDQPSAVRALCDEFALNASGTRDLRRPPGYFLVGPTGVGKNHLVESLKRALEGVWQIDVPMLTIEGPNYTYPSDINELRGATRGFIRSDEEGLLTAFEARASKAPLSIILVDEVEKAHAQLRTFFLSILDRGTTTDNRVRELNLANSLIFFTSNLGYSDAQQRGAPIGYGDDDARREAADRDVRAGLKRALSPEFVQRIRLIHFGRLTEASAEKILDLELAAIARRYEEVHGLSLVLDPSARLELLRRGFSAEQGARHLRSTLEQVCNVAVSQRIRKDAREAPLDSRGLLARLRDLRVGNGAFDANALRREVLQAVRARLDYAALRIAYEDGEFVYRPEGGAS